MTWLYSDDPEKDFLNYDSEQTRWLNSRPVCCRCGDPIQDEDAYEIEGNLYCVECIEDMRVSIDD